MIIVLLLILGFEPFVAAVNPLTQIKTAYTASWCAAVMASSMPAPAASPQHSRMCGGPWMRGRAGDGAGERR